MRAFSRFCGTPIVRETSLPNCQRSKSGTRHQSELLSFGTGRSARRQSKFMPKTKPFPFRNSPLRNDWASICADSGQLDRGLRSVHGDAIRPDRSSGAQRWTRKARREERDPRNSVSQNGFTYLPDRHLRRFRTSRSWPSYSSWSFDRTGSIIRITTKETKGTKRNAGP